MVATPPDALIVADEDVAVGQVLDVGELVGDTCVMTHEAVEVQVDVSVDEPKAGISLYISEDCELIVANKYRSIGPRISVFGGSGASSSNRYTATAKSWWRDFADIELAATTVIFTYEEISNGFEFVGLTRQYCNKKPWWRTVYCRFYTKSKNSSKIKATAEGKFKLATGQYLHRQRPTFTAREGGEGTASCWSSTHLRSLTFDCDGSLVPN